VFTACPQPSGGLAVTEVNPFRTIQPAVEAAKFGDTIYRTEWVLDGAKHGVPVRSIAIRSTEKDVPIILGLTGVTQW
jgi:hypothetical protein